MNPLLVLGVMALLALVWGVALFVQITRRIGG